MSFLLALKRSFNNVKAVFVVCVLAAPAMAEDFDRTTPMYEWIGTSCSLAKSRSWAEFEEWIDRFDVSMETALAQTVCEMAATTHDPYRGNVLEASARYSGFVADFVKLATRYLLRDNNEHEIFVALVTSKNVPIDQRRSGGLFAEMVEAWGNVPDKRADLLIAARAICLNIDRFNVEGLEDIRANECMTPPFVFPPRGD